VATEATALRLLRTTGSFPALTVLRRMTDAAAISGPDAVESRSNASLEHDKRYGG